MATPLAVKQGLAANKVKGVPKEWSAEWFQRFVTTHMQNADYRNAVAGPGISITATQGESQPGTIALGSGGIITTPVVIQASVSPSIHIESTSGSIFGLEISAPSGDYAGLSLAGNGNSFDLTDFEIYQDGAGIANLYNGANAGMRFFTNGLLRMTILSGGGLTIAAPSAGNGLVVTGIANQYVAELLANSTSGQSYGLYVQAGTTTADYALSVLNQAGNTNYLLVQGGGAVFVPSIGTTASAANAFINSASSPVNSILRSTSARRFKTDIQDVEDIGQVIGQLRPITYRSKAAADDPSKRWYGLIAEEVAAVAPRLVHYDANGRPDGVQYDRLAVLLLAYLQQKGEV